MNRAISILILALASMGSFLIFYNQKPVSNPIQTNASVSDAEQKWESKIVDQENVIVTVTPITIDLSSQAAEWKFDIIMDTHSVELDQDMTKISVLVDDQGKEYEPLRWEGAPLGGHHREGVLVFAPFTPYSQHLKMIIRNIGNAERVFSWILIK